ncbi:MAG: hypothetical protein CVV44_12190 [Spirochaetae bacterium HGW-Spirochaetae-1]|jgi:hypothetical protein|nr:MAG: hypothetical protein CVV44_12190 [Spirochaetae bacterium HGW-Spirochaetae-1]
MPITQVSVAVENTPGKLLQITEVLEHENINIKGIMASSVLSPVQLHLIVDDPERAVNVLKSSGYAVETKEVIAVATPDHPGGFNAVLRPLTEAKINIDALYPFIMLRGHDAIVILDVDKIEEAKKVLKKHWVKTFGPEIYKS